MNCDRFLASLPAYISEELSEEERIEWRTHIVSCPSCRAAAVDREPTLMLVGSGMSPPEPEAVERCVTGVVSRIRQEGLERRLSRGGRWWWAAAAAVIVACLGLALWFSGADGPSSPASAMREGQSTVAQQPPMVELEMGPEVVMYQVADGPGDQTVTAVIVNPALEL